MALTFYYGSGSPFAWKVWLVLEHKGIPYEFRLLSFDRGDTKTPEFLAVNPRGKVPAILENGFALWESTAIAEYLEERYPDKPILPGDAKARAIIRRIAAEAENYLAPPITELFRMALYRDEPASQTEIAEAQGKVMEELATLETRLTGPYLAGPLSLADFTAFPYVRLLKRINERKPGKGIADERLPAKIGAWIKRIEALPYYGKTMPPHWKG